MPMRYWFNADEIEGILKSLEKDGMISEDGVDTFWECLKALKKRDD